MKNASVLGTSQSERHQNDNNPANLLSMLFVPYHLEFYLLLVQLAVGLALNMIILCSLVLVHHRNKRKCAANSCGRQQFLGGKGRQCMPVVDIILATITITILLGLLTKTLPQIMCIQGKVNLVVLFGK